MTRFKHSPIERHEALTPFSRDHYTGLVQAQHLSKAAESDAVARRKAIAEFVDAWDTEIAAHFADEERLLAELAHQFLHQRHPLAPLHLHVDQVFEVQAMLLI